MSAEVDSMDADDEESHEAGRESDKAQCSLKTELQSNYFIFCKHGSWDHKCTIIPRCNPINNAAIPFFQTDPISKILSICRYRYDLIPAQFLFLINVEFLYCPTKAKDLNSLECETEKNDFKVYLN